MHKVWHRDFDGWWYVTLREDGRRKQLKLVKAPKNKDGRKLAEKQLLTELSAREHREETPDVPAWITVAHVLDGFLRHSHEEHDPLTYTWYRNFLDSFKAKWGKLRISLLKKKHVKAWLKEKGYNPTSQNRAIGAVKRAFNWAVEEEHIPRNPIAHLRKPKSLERDRILTQEERALILASIRDAAFRDYVAALTLTGARPGEVARVTAANFHPELGIWKFEKHKTAKQTGKPRIIYLCEEALEMTRRLIQLHPDGPIFRNTRDKPWTRNAVRIRFRNLREKLPQLKGVIAYTYRSSFATDALEAGVPDTSVAILLGHVGGTATLHKFYARLSHKVEHLKEAATKATQLPRADAGPPDTAA